jgi:AraC family transcriptional activator of pobA
MRKKNDIILFDKVVDLYNSLNITIEQDSEFSMNSLLELHNEIPYKSPVFRTNYYSFVFIKNGKGNYTTDEQTFEYDSSVLYFTNPGHLKAFEFWELKEAYLITFSETFLKENIHQNIFEDFPFLLAETVPPQPLTGNEFQELEILYLQILKEYQSKSVYKNKIIASLLVVLLLKIKSQFWANYQPREEGNRSSQIVKKFKQALEQHYKDLSNGKIELLHQPQDYANMQNLNASYLSQVIKSKTGKSISHWIADKTIGQAKALLLHSFKPVKEIAFQLGFSETAHFSNYFKKHTRKTPTSFKKLNQ